VSHDVGRASGQGLMGNAGRARLCRRRRGELGRARKRDEECHVIRRSCGRRRVAQDATVAAGMSAGCRQGRSRVICGRGGMVAAMADNCERIGWGGVRRRDAVAGRPGERNLNRDRKDHQTGQDASNRPLHCRQVSTDAGRYHRPLLAHSALRHRSPHARCSADCAPRGRISRIARQEAACRGAE
jgi:hypothetical protein